MWQLQYLRALEIGAEFVAQAERERLLRSVPRRGERPESAGPVRRAIALGARSVGRAATSVAGWAEPCPTC